MGRVSGNSLAGEGAVEVGGHVVLQGQEAPGQVQLAGLACRDTTTEGQVS